MSSWQTPFIPGSVGVRRKKIWSHGWSLNLLSLQNCTWWDKLIAQTETRWSLESGKGCWVANVLKKAFFPPLHFLISPIHFSSIQQKLTVISPSLQFPFPWFQLQTRSRWSSFWHWQKISSYLTPYWNACVIHLIRSPHVGILSSSIISKRPKVSIVQ